MKPPRSDSVMPVIRYLAGGVARYQPGETLALRRLGDYEVVWILEGDVVYHRVHQDFPAPAGTVILARPGIREAYTWDRRGVTSLAYFHFDFTRLPTDWPAPPAWPVTQALAGDDVVRPLLRCVVSRWCMAHAGKGAGLTPPPWVQRAASALLGSLVVGPMGAEPTVDDRVPAPARRALTWLASRVERATGRPIDLGEFAAAAKVSPKHLCRVFRDAFDATPMQAVRLVRLERALPMVLRSNLSVKEIAHRCGFASAFHFSRCFRTAFDLAPSAARAAAAAGRPVVRVAHPRLNVATWSALPW